MTVVSVTDAAGLDALRPLDRSISSDLAGLVRALVRVSPDEGWDFERIRADFEATAARIDVPEDVVVTRIRVVGRDAEGMVPTSATNRVTLYLHGGAFTIGSLATVRALAARFATATKSVVISLDYRLAPEHPYPAALDDAVAALAQVRAEHPGAVVVVAGDSAGAGLALACATESVARGQAPPDAVVAMSPWTDLSLPHVDAMDECEDPQAPHWLLARSADALLDGAAAEGASPLHGELGTLPPTLLQVGLAESLLDDSLAFAAAAFAAGSPLTLQVWAGMPHVWQAFAPRLAEANDAMAAAQEWLTGAVGPRDTFDE